MKNIIYIIISLSLLASCHSDHSHDEVLEDSTAVEAVFIDDANAEVTAADTSSTGVYQEEVNKDENLTLQESLRANANSGEAVEEGGMSFCDCVKKQKQLEKTMLETEDDAEFDNAMEELGKMKTGECKILFEENNLQSTKKEHTKERLETAYNFIGTYCFPLYLLRIT